MIRTKMGTGLACAAALAMIAATSVVLVDGQLAGASTDAAPPAPTGLTAKAVSATKVNLAWNVVTGAVSYKVERSSTASGPFAAVGSTTTRTFTNTGLHPSTTYYYVVQAVNSAGVSSSRSAPASATTLPAAPIGLTASTVSDSEIMLSWTAETGATSFRVLRATVSGGPYTKVGSPSSNSFADTGLSAATTYFYTIQALNSTGGASARSAQLTAETGPAPPTGVAATAVSAKEIDLTWSVSAGATGYTVLRSTTSSGGYTAVASLAGTSFANTGLNPGTTYYYEVEAKNSSGAFTFSSQVSATTVPAAPTGPTATAVSATEIDLSWSVSAGATGYTVLRSTTSGGPYAPVGSPTATSFANTGLSPGTTYFYVVEAVDTTGPSAPSAEVSATTVPAAPTGPTATAVSAAEIDLSWSVSAGATGYTVLRSTTSGGPYAPVGSPTATSFANTGLSPGTTYFYVVEAVDTTGPSAPSAEVSATTVPAAPTGLTATAVSTTAINLSWSASAGATGYTVLRSTTSGGPYAPVGSPTATSFANTGLSPGTTYFYVVEAVDTTGPSAPSAQVSATTRRSS